MSEFLSKARDMNATASSALDSIPPQYRDLPSDIAEELWQQKIFTDPEKTEAEHQRREQALSALRAFEEHRAVADYQRQDIVAAKLSYQEKTDFEQELNRAPFVIAAYFRGEEALPVSITSFEQHVLAKMRAQYHATKEQNPSAPVAFQFSKPADAYMYGALLKKIATARIYEGRQTQENQQIDEIREQLGIQTQDVEQHQNNSFGEFKYGHGETDQGMFWHSYSNSEWSERKSKGSVEWGKERLYFDVPLDSLDSLKELLLEKAQQLHIPLAFKYIDASQTLQSHIDGKETRFVANFSNASDAKRLHASLLQDQRYLSLHADRSLDYQGYQLDDKAHYASGYRERREPLKRIIESAEQQTDGSYLYLGPDGLNKRPLSAEQYATFKKQYNEMPDPRLVWEQAK